MKRGVAKFRMPKGFLGYVLTCAIILVVPVWSLVELTGFFRYDTGRKAAPLPAFQVRVADAGKPDPVLFNEPLLSVTFDDGWESIYTQAMPVLQRDGIHTTQYVLSGVEKEAAYMSWEQIAAMQKAGHEIACHSVSHPDLTTLNDSKLMEQLKGCKTTLTQHYGSVTNFASPYGAETGHTVNEISKVFTSQRNSNGELGDGITADDVNTADNFSRYDIIGITVRGDTTIAQLQAALDYAKAHNAWVVLTYHQADDENSKFALDITKMTEQLNYLNKSDMRIVTVNQALASLSRKGVK
ncbi:MAG TPA: polysaccharide deacetylase family protein [Candidatus Saccharimonadales bacterium]|nr:polysaccharide deacetylase family protein [Candidatus Saccharimonadales bacterium]